MTMTLITRSVSSLYTTLRLALRVKRAWALAALPVWRKRNLLRAAIFVRSTPAQTVLIADCHTHFLCIVYKTVAVVANRMYFAAFNLMRSNGH